MGRMPLYYDFQKPLVPIDMFGLVFYDFKLKDLMIFN